MDVHDLIDLSLFCFFPLLRISWQMLGFSCVSLVFVCQFLQVLILSFFKTNIDFFVHMHMRGLFVFWVCVFCLLACSRACFVSMEPEEGTEVLFQSLSLGFGAHWLDQSSWPVSQSRPHLPISAPLHWDYSVGHHTWSLPVSSRSDSGSQALAGLSLYAQSCVI